MCAMSRFCKSVLGTVRRLGSPCNPTRKARVDRLTIPTASVMRSHVCDVPFCNSVLGTVRRLGSPCNRRVKRGWIVNDSDRFGDPLACVRCPVSVTPSSAQCDVWIRHVTRRVKRGWIVNDSDRFGGTFHAFVPQGVPPKTRFTA